MTYPIEDLARQAIACGLDIHRELGPGLLESAYQALLSHSLENLGFRVERQKPVPLARNGLLLEEAFRADLLIEGRLVLELKSVERLAPVHSKQLLTYLRLLDLPLGLLMNFGAATLKEGIHRVVNMRADTSLIELQRYKTFAPHGRE